MKFAKKVVIAVNLEDDPAKIFAPVKALEFLKYAEIHLVHAFQTTTYALGFGEFPLAYPIEEDRRTIEQSVLALLHKVSLDLFPDNSFKVIQKCLFSDDPKRKFCDYLGEVKADTVFIATREKRGLFESSFAAYVNRHSDANLIILKNRT
jgi:hypothetical protein